MTFVLISLTHREVRLEVLRLFTWHGVVHYKYKPMPGSRCSCTVYLRTPRTTNPAVELQDTKRCIFTILGEVRRAPNLLPSQNLQVHHTSEIMPTHIRASEVTFALHRSVFIQTWNFAEKINLSMDQHDKFLLQKLIGYEICYFSFFVFRYFRACMETI